MEASANVVYVLQTRTFSAAISLCAEDNGVRRGSFLGGKDWCSRMTVGYGWMDVLSDKNHIHIMLNPFPFRFFYG